MSSGVALYPQEEDRVSVYYTVYLIGEVVI